MIDTEVWQVYPNANSDRTLLKIRRRFGVCRWISSAYAEELP